MQTDMNSFQVGQQVYFGRGQGEQTLGEIVKLNPSKAKVKQLEKRGEKRQYEIGTIWTVPYSLIQATTNDVVNELSYDPCDKINNLVLEAIFLCHTSQTSSQTIQRQLKGLQEVFGRLVSKAESVKWRCQQISHLE